MTNNELESLPVLSWHLLFLGRIYSFIGWLGMLGSVFLLLSGLDVQPGSAPPPVIFPGMHWLIAPVLLIGWSTILLSFSKDITRERKWTTGIRGCAIALFSLISVPIGTAIGAYTLYVLFLYKRSDLQSAKDSLTV